MKKALIIAMVCSICLATSACSGQNTEPTETAASTTQNDIETTKPTEKPTEPPTENVGYTAIELADKSLNEIKALMDDDYKSEHIQLSNAFSSDGCQYIYNNDKLNKNLLYKIFYNYYKSNHFYNLLESQKFLLMLFL